MMNNRSGYSGHNGRSNYNGYNGRNGGRNSRDVDFKILEHLGTLDSYTNNWNKEVNIVIWNDNQPKVDIRDWDPAHERMSRGITLMGREAEYLGRILSRRFACRHEFDSVPYLREISIHAQDELSAAMYYDDDPLEHEEARPEGPAADTGQQDAWDQEHQAVPDAGELYREEPGCAEPGEYIAASAQEPADEEEQEAACL